MCITVQIGERGKFTDVQICERGKQRVKCIFQLSISMLHIKLLSISFTPLVSRLNSQMLCLESCFSDLDEMEHQII